MHIYTYACRATYIQCYIHTNVHTYIHTYIMHMHTYTYIDRQTDKYLHIFTYYTYITHF